MGAKAYILVGLALAATGCTGGLQRLAPPGIVKYEDRAKGVPINPQISERMEASKDAPGGGFPNLSEQPTDLPEGVAKPERDAMLAEMLQTRDALAAAVEADRLMATAEREGDPAEARDALDVAVAADDAAAKRERRKPIKNKKIK